MHKPDPIETILARLMPPAMSEGAQRDLDAMLDALAADSPAPCATLQTTGRTWRQRFFTGGIAAASVAAALVFPMASPPSPPSWAGIVPAGQTPAAGLVLVSESDRIESMTDEGWQEASDGSAMRAMRLNVVEENSLLDQETGIVMRVSQPREEILLLPVSTF